MVQRVFWVVQLGCWRFLFNLTHCIQLWCSVFLLITYNCLVMLQGGWGHLVARWNNVEWNRWLLLVLDNHCAKCRLSSLHTNGQTARSRLWVVLAWVEAEQSMDMGFPPTPSGLHCTPNPEISNSPFLDFFLCFLSHSHSGIPFPLGTALLHIFLTLSNMRAEGRLLFSFSLHFKCLI